MSRESVGIKLAEIKRAAELKREKVAAFSSAAIAEGTIAVVSLHEGTPEFTALFGIVGAVSTGIAIKNGLAAIQLGRESAAIEGALAQHELSQPSDAEPSIA